MTYQSPQPVHGHPGQPATRRNRMLVIGAVVGAVLFVCCCGAIARFADDNQPNAASPTSAAPTGVAVPTVISTPPVEVTQPATEPPVATTSAAPAEAVMPDLVGENAAVADDRLRKLGFTNIQFGSQDENDTVVLLLANWTVTKQSTKAGMKVPVDTLIVLTCTKKA